MPHASLTDSSGVLLGRELIMNKKYLLAGLFVASLGTTSIATAGAGDTYAGVSVGNASPDLSGINLDSAIGWKIFGGYALNDVLAVEGGYISFGEMDGPLASSVEPTGFEVAAVGNFPINSQFSLFGKVGLLAWDTKVISFSGVSSTTTDTDVFFGLGGQYEISGNLAVRASWERYTMDDLDIDFLSASAVFGF